MPNWLPDQEYSFAHERQKDWSQSSTRNQRTWDSFCWLWGNDRQTNGKISSFRNPPFFPNPRQQTPPWVFLMNIWDLFMIQYPSQEEYFSLSNANLMMDVKTYGQILENTFLYCTVAEVKHLRDKFLVLHGYADKLQLPVVALIKQVTHCSSHACKN